MSAKVAGGILAEALEDVVFRALPIERADALDMLDELQAILLETFERGGTVLVPAFAVRA